MHLPSSGWNQYNSGWRQQSSDWTRSSWRQPSPNWYSGGWKRSPSPKGQGKERGKSSKRGTTPPPQGQGKCNFWEKGNCSMVQIAVSCTQKIAGALQKDHASTVTHVHLGTCRRELPPQPQKWKPRRSQKESQKRKAKRTAAP